MTKYEVYEWLNRPTKLTYDIKAKIRLAEEIRSGLLPTAIRYDKDKIVTSYGTNADPMTEILARVEAIQKEIAECAELSNQRVSALLRQMKEDGMQSIRRLLCVSGSRHGLILLSRMSRW